jgi:hypothetical protein
MSQKRQRGSNFSTAEDCQLARSWLNISQAPGTGVGQKPSTFWERVEAHFHQHLGGENGCRRSSRSLATKWGVIQHDVAKFVGVYAAIKDLNPSGASEDDMVQKALELYKSNNSDQKNSEFGFIHVWYILRDHPKWQDLRSKPEPSSQAVKRIRLDANDEVVEDDEDESSKPRSQGTRAVKDQKKLAFENARSAKGMVAAELIKGEAMQLKARMALFSAPVNEMDAEAQEFFKLARAEVLQAMRGKGRRAVSAQADDEQEDAE